MDAAILTDGASEIIEADEAPGDGLLEEGVGSALSTSGGGDVTAGSAADGAEVGGIGVETGGALGGGADTGGRWVASRGATGGLTVRVITAGGEAISF